MPQAEPSLQDPARRRADNKGAEDAQILCGDAGCVFAVLQYHQCCMCCCPSMLLRTSCGVFGITLFQML
jgi:hypothetical protein